MDNVTVDSILNELKITVHQGVVVECDWILNPCEQGGGGGVEETELQNTSAADLLLATQVRREVEEYLSGERRDFDVEVAQRGTDFQHRVWRELQKIPYGITVSYSEIARRIGHPRSVRSVANAIGANRISILIPCHRVVRAGGETGGYRGGVDTKKFLIEMEKGNFIFKG